jgi:hypothetical protein
MSKFEDMFSCSAFLSRRVPIINNTEERKLITDVSMREFLQRLAKAHNRIRSVNAKKFVNKHIALAHKSMKYETGIALTHREISYLNKLASGEAY